MARLFSSVLLVLGLVGCGPGRPGGFDDALSEEQDFGDGDGDTTDDDPDEGVGDGDGDGDGDEEGLRVLFIGNSYTYTNDLPGMVESMAIASSIPVSITSLTHGGYFVASHLMHPETAELLGQGFDVVVINGEPFEPLLAYEVFEYGVETVVNMAGDARIVLYQTWPRHPTNPELIELGLTVEEMWAGLEQGYYQVSLTVDAEIATVGAAWMYVLEHETWINLYSADGNHPSYAGSYLAACVIFGVIFDETCTTNGWEPAGFPPEQRDRLRIVADTINGKLDP
jgi:hypothetical protein